MKKLPFVFMITVFLLVACGAPAENQTTATSVGVLVKPSNPYGIGGYWKSNEGGWDFTVSLSDTKGRRATLAMRGELNWDGDGNLTTGDYLSKNMIWIQTEANPSQWYKITSIEVFDGLLELNAEDGIYTYFTEGRSASFPSRPTAQAALTGDGNWKGPASFIITGFDSVNFTASIYQDSRNYQIQ